MAVALGHQHFNFCFIGCVRGRGDGQALCFGAGFGVATAVAILLVALLAYLVLRKNRYDENHLTQKVTVQA